eukprot:11171647-Lingulodinium_polyedra.AAC.1
MDGWNTLISPRVKTRWSLVARLRNQSPNSPRETTDFCLQLCSAHAMRWAMRDVVATANDRPSAPRVALPERLGRARQIV